MHAHFTARAHGKDWTPIEPESLKRAYDELLEGAGVDVLFCSVLSDVKAADGHVEAIIVSNKSGLCAYSAKTYIDATGDGDLAAWAGAQFCLGDETTHETQLATLCFSVANVKEQIYRDMPDLHYGNNPNSPIKQWAESDEFRISLIIIFARTLRQGAWSALMQTMFTT